MTQTPKPVKMWAVYDPSGDIFYWTISPTEDESKRKPYLAWDTLCKNGYRCIPVIVSPAPKKRKKR